MDSNKLDVLRELSYRILPTCGLCSFSCIPPATDWGTCGLHTYQHGKHTGPIRQLSINRSGGCPSFRASTEAVARLEGFAALTDF